MAKLKNGIMGGLSGKIGPVVGASWKRKHYIRSRPAPRTKPFSRAQLEHQAKFALVADFLLSMRSALQTGFPEKASDMSGYNAALRHAFHRAVTGEYPDLRIDYSQVLISDGYLFGTDGYSVRPKRGHIIFTWNDNSGKGHAKHNDKVWLVVYCEDKNCSHVYSQPYLRSTGTARVSAHGFGGKRVQTYLTFISADGTRAATSLYTGPLVVI
jgi:hypothetical protein